MDAENWGLGQLVYKTSLLLLYPTLALLALSFLRMMWHLGELAYDGCFGRTRPHAQGGRQLRDITVDQTGSVVPALQKVAQCTRHHPQLRRFVRNLLDELGRGSRKTLSARIDHLVAQIEADLARDVNRVRVLVRLGPCLGLAGTLIPLGPGLMALSEGDLSRLSAQLVVAFSTTVVGLLIGGISYVITMARAHSADLVISDIELVADVVGTLMGLSAERSTDCAARLETEEVSA